MHQHCFFQSGSTSLEIFSTAVPIWQLASSDTIELVVEAKVPHVKILTTQKIHGRVGCGQLIVGLRTLENIDDTFRFVPVFGLAHNTGAPIRNYDIHDHNHSMQ